MTIRAICVYCGSADRVSPIYFQAARQVGAAIARRGWRLWYGAGSTGLMGALAQGALERGGKVYGVLPRLFNTPQLAHSALTRLEVVASMHTRKRRLFRRADAFLALPGGYGTFEEFFEMLTWAQIGLHSKPIGLLNVAGYFDPLLQMVQRALEEGFIYDEHKALFICSEDIEALLEALESFQPPPGLERWLTRQD